MLDFNKYNDVVQVKDYDGFIDRDGNYYKVVLRREKSYKDSHNIWAEKFLKEKIDIKNLKEVMKEDTEEEDIDKLFRICIL